MEQSPIGKYPLVSKMPPPVPEGLESTPLACRTPNTQRFEDECAQHLGDRLTALEERMSKSETAGKQTARVQAQAMGTLSKLKASLMAQQATLGEITHSLAPEE